MFSHDKSYYYHDTIEIINNVCYRRSSEVKIVIKVRQRLRLFLFLLLSYYFLLLFLLLSNSSIPIFLIKPILSFCSIIHQKLHIIHLQLTIILSLQNNLRRISRFYPFQSILFINHLQLIRLNTRFFNRLRLFYSMR